MSTILITGGTGLIGSALTKMLVAKGHEIIILSREANAPRAENISYAQWNISEQKIDANAIAKADYIIHLAGANVAGKRWTADRKKEIVDSRTQSSRLLVKGLTETPNKVKAVISASAIGWYGPDSRRPSKKKFTEDVVADADFLGETCRLWEQSIEPVTTLGKRLVKLRIGILLSNDGGALAEFKKPVKLGVAGILGSGKQIVSWIHIHDVCRMFLYAIEHEQLHGAYNAVAPTPISNKRLTLTLAEKMKGKFFIPMHVPAFALKLALGGMSIEVLKSATVSSEKIESTGFTFSFPTIEEALSDLINKEQ